MNRRELWGDVLVSAASGTASAVGIAAVVWGPKLREPEAEYFPDALAGPAEYIAGAPIIIQKGVNIRTEPSIPQPPAVRLPRERAWSRNNVVEWDSIEAVGGVPLNGAGAFAVEYAEFVKGEDTYKYTRRPGEHGYWIRLKVQVKGKGERAGFINYSLQTADFVEPVGSFYLFGYQWISERELLLASKPQMSIKPEVVGRVTVLPDKIQLARYMWSSSLMGKLDQRVPLTLDERPFEETVVFPWGETTAEHLQRKQEDKPVKVFDLPPNLASQLGLSKIVGFVRLGTTIKNVILTRARNAWGLFRRADVEGDILDSEGNVLDVPLEQILVIGGDFVLRKDHRDAQSYLAELEGKVKNPPF